MEHNDYYYEYNRNCSCEECTCGKKDCLPKKDIVDIDIPDYYIGKTHKYEARKVVEDFELSYNIGTAVTYLLRARRKHKSPIECITKAMAHLKFELDKIENEEV